jgi:uncharacterized damage-inducible protein DinB
MNYDDLRTLLDYHYWARDRMLAALDALPTDRFMRDLGSSFKSARDTAAHIYGAEWVWYQRWLGDSPTSTVPFDRFGDTQSLRTAWIDLERQVRTFLEQLGPAGIERTFEYRLFNGAAGRSVFWQMLQHVVNHASYHRGQITTMIRQLGAAPPQSMDLIAFYRERMQPS